MPGPLPHPSPRRRNRREVTRTLRPDGTVRGPELPAEDPDGSGWHPRTLAWWDTWRASPQAQTFSATDWQYLIDTAALHSTMWSAGRIELAGEVRLRAAKFGATPEDRARLRVHVTTPS